MVPEIQENHCVYVDAFLGARKADQQGPISPYLGYSKEEEARTQRKIFRYWRDRGIDVAGEHVVGIRIDRFVGLQPHTASQMHLIEDIPDELFCGNPAHFGFTTVTEPETFQERFWLEFLPFYYRNNPGGTEDPASMIDGTDICMPCLWCDEPTLIAYSKEGYEEKTWKLPADWQDVAKVSAATITGESTEPIGDVEVADGCIALALERNRTVRISK